jgi:hypothetical protein
MIILDILILFVGFTCLSAAISGFIWGRPETFAGSAVIGIALLGFLLTLAFLCFYSVYQNHYPVPIEGPQSLARFSLLS